MSSLVFDDLKNNMRKYVEEAEAEHTRRKQLVGCDPDDHGGREASAA